MPEFTYLARETSGREVRGLISAATEQEAIGTLTGRGQFPTQLSLAPTAEAQRRAAGKRISSRKLALMYSQLADLLRAGVPLLRSLELLEQQSTHPTLIGTLQDVREQVGDGTRLADALRRHPRAFGDLAVSMVRAGEEGGFLEDVLQRIAVFVDHQEDLKGRVVGALVYPLFLMATGMLIVTGMLVFFVPKFAPIFDRLRERGELPLPTQILMAGSDFMQVYGIWLAVALVGLGVWIGRMMQTERGRLLADTWRLRMWGLGPIVRSLAISRFCRILGTLLKNGVPILPSLRIAKDATGNQLLTTAIAEAAENISSGKSLARPLAASGEFPVEIVEMIAVGEEANNLEQVLLNIAETTEKHTQRRLDLFVRMLEPLMLLAMAVVIMFMVIALLLPVFRSAGAFG